MHLRFLLRDFRPAGSVFGKLARHLMLASAAATMTQAAYDGPVSAAADAFGGPGPYSVVTDTFPSPGWPEQVVTVFRPGNSPGRRPAWFFCHGFAGINPALYGELINHLASHGSVVVFSPYPPDLRPANDYPIMFDGFTTAADRFSDFIDTSRVGFAGHSFGGGAVPALALRALRERGWGGNGLALLLLAPWYSYFVSDADLASFPVGTQAIVQVYEDDVINDHRMAVDIFTHLSLPAADKDYLLIRSDRIDGFNYRADHNVPTGASNPRNGTFNAHDSWGLLRLAQALTASTWQHDSTARAAALGNGTVEQTRMGATAGGRALRPMVATDAPVLLYPSARYREKFDGPLNPRRGATLPTMTPRPRLSNLSARARSGIGGAGLIVGATVTGERPNSLLVRAVGPSLQLFGAADPMPNPRLVTYAGTAVDIDVDDWGQTPSIDTLNASTTTTGAFTFLESSRDAALLASFSPGMLTVHASPEDGIPGVALLEIYEADEDDATYLSNLSARARIAEGEDVLIAGFVTTGGGSLRLLLRGAGPALSVLGVEDALQDPVLEIYRGNELIAMNDNWSVDSAQAAANAAAAQSVGAFPFTTGSRDAGVLLTLPPGVYTAVLRSRNGRPGIGLVEVYLVP